MAALRHVNPELASLVDGADTTIKSKTWDDSKITAHHGIIPTMHQGTATGLTDKERSIYDLIIRAYLAQFYPVHEYMSTVVGLDVAGVLSELAVKLSPVAGGVMYTQSMKQARVVTRM